MEKVVDTWRMSVHFEIVYDYMVSLGGKKYPSSKLPHVLFFLLIQWMLMTTG